VSRHSMGNENVPEGAQRRQTHGAQQAKTGTVSGEEHVARGRKEGGWIWTRRVHSGAGKARVSEGRVGDARSNQSERFDWQNVKKIDEVGFGSFL